MDYKVPEIPDSLNMEEFLLKLHKNQSFLLDRFYIFFDELYSRLDYRGKEIMYKIEQEYPVKLEK